MSHHHQRLKNGSAPALSAGATTSFEEMERALNDALWAVARTLDSASLFLAAVPLVGISVYAENCPYLFREQLATHSCGGRW